MALLSLERFEEALDCCKRCLEFDPTNPGVQLLRDKAQNGQEAKNKKDLEKQERLRKEAESQRQLELGFKVTFLQTHAHVFP